MSRKKYVIISPDGFPMTPEPFATKDEAEAFIPSICRRYEHQGYYAAVGRRIPLDELPAALRICDEDSAFMSC